MCLMDHASSRGPAAFLNRRAAVALVSATGERSGVGDWYCTAFGFRATVIHANHPIQEYTRMIRRSLFAAIGLILTIVATACGAQPATPNASTSSDRTTPVPAATHHTANSTPRGSTPTLQTSALPTIAPTTARTSPYTGIEQGRTVEGYHTLGSDSAPVTLVMYSDFF